ncbi:MAG: beta-galactosidase [Candidatus Dormiibacterota bacterium]
MRVELDTKGFRVEGQERPLVAAQFDAFRQNSIWWPRTLDAIKNAGIEIVSIFICWDFHELSRGEFDFDGTTNSSRNLKGLLELCAQKDLLVWARPGPIMDDEWETRGPARDVMRLDRLHPAFLARTAEYVEEVCRVLVPAQTTRGGPVALLSIDNEILYPYSTPASQADVDGDVCVPYDDAYYASAFSAWLKTKYGTCADANAALGATLSRWEDVTSPRYGTDSIGYLYESFLFINHQITQYTRLCRDLYRAQGIDVGINTNFKQLLAYADWSRIGRELDAVGMCLFTPRDMPGDQALVANWWIRLQRAQFEFAWAADIQAGWIGLDDEFGYISEDHSEYVPMAAQAAGIRGLNFYSFVERDDWNYSPVNATGKIRPNRYEAFRRVVASYAGIGQRDEQLCDVGLIYSLADHQAIYFKSAQDWSTLADHWAMFEEPKASAGWWRTFQRLVEADVDFRLWIPGVSSGTRPRILVHASLPIETSDVLESLAAAISQAGRVVAVTDIANQTPGGVVSATVKDAVAAAACEGRLVRCSADDVVDVVASLGAKSYVRADYGRVWTFLYRGEDGSLVLGAWNAGDAVYHGPLRISPDVLAPSTVSRWIVEPSRGTRAALGQMATSVTVTLAPHSARVFLLIDEQTKGLG